MAESRKLVLVLAGLGLGAATAWLLRDRGDESGWFETEGVVRAGPPVDAPGTTSASAAAEASAGADTGG